MHFSNIPRKQNGEIGCLFKPAESHKSCDTPCYEVCLAQEFISMNSVSCLIAKHTYNFKRLNQANVLVSHYQSPSLLLSSSLLSTSTSLICMLLLPASCQLWLSPDLFPLIEVSSQDLLNFPLLEAALSPAALVNWTDSQGSLTAVGCSTRKRHYHVVRKTAFPLQATYFMSLHMLNSTFHQLTVTD